MAPINGSIGRKKVCIVTSGCISSAPRVVKEADALTAAGFNVIVVASQNRPWMVQWDAELAATKQWPFTAVRSDRSSRAWGTWLLSGLRQRCYQQVLQRWTDAHPAAEHAAGRTYAELTRLAVQQNADLYVGHGIPGLAAACRAAEQRSVPAAFDAEDDHVGEFAFGEEQSANAQLVRLLEARYLPGCAYVTAASDGISDALTARYGIRRPVPVYNVFPLADREVLDGKVKNRVGSPLSLCWYSQQVGLNRGLQDIVRAAGLVRGEIQVHIRGSLADDVRENLLALAQTSGSAGKIHFHPQVPPAELLSRVAEHDVGLALEQPVSPNRLATVTNKVFFCMLAGLAVIATDTPGQRRVLETTPDAGFLYAPGDVPALAKQLQRLLDDPALLLATKQASLAAAQTVWNWETESQKLPRIVHAATATRNPV